ncbi:N-acetylmuramoyl-L-alanine amidase family protein [Vallitalea okinawensis]|uniref:N-acetylmuramoyl-L-alanine amidase family protein n=1 Tax=Vallitalea okinawensis TaxID=2078660 RepID=UPI000CFB2F81|nr:N-acetylmuramoyl-L-alanine amidase [Vallitalea okinawensis]
MKPVLIIDPGHGGRDFGGGSNIHWKEKDKVLKISLYQYARFKHLGVPVKLTRESDVYLDPKKRTGIVRKSEARYCLSNHINAGGGQGAEFIHSIYSDGELEERLKEELEKAGQNIRRVFTRVLPSDPSKDYYYMHRDTGIVNTTIAEYGFADNDKDTRRLLNHWQEDAEAIIKSYTEFLGFTYTLPEDKPSHCYGDSWLWAKEDGLVDGTNSISPATREMVSKILYRSQRGE